MKSNHYPNWKRMYTWVCMVITCLFTGMFTADAQVSSYIYSQSNGSYNPITGGTVYGTTTSDDQLFVDPSVPLGGYTQTGVGIPIGFNFVFNGTTFDRLAINNNGWISLGQSALGAVAVNMTSASYYPISTTTLASPTAALRDRIAGIGSDLQGQAGSEIRVETIGSPGSYVCVVQWTNYRKYAATGQSFNWQIRLNETSNVVEIVYGTMTFNASSYTAQVGLGGEAATDFNNRTTTTNWNTTTAGGTNSASCAISTSVTTPVSGFTMAWTPASCLAPSGVNASNITTNDADINFTCGSCGGNYILEYGVSPFTTPGTDGNPGGGTVIPGGSSPMNFGGALSPSTTYTVYMREDCGGGNFSNNTLAYSFTTACVNVNTFPYTESFGASMPACWSASEDVSGASYHWASTTADPTYGAAGPQSGTNFMYLYVYLASTTYNSYNLTTGGFDLPSTPMQLNYYYFLGEDGYQSSPDPLIIQISTDNGTTWTDIYNHNNNNSTFASSNSVSFWTQNIIDLTAYANQSVKFRFKANSNYGYGLLDIGLDEVKIEEIPACPGPTGLTATNITDISADLGWGAVGSAVSYDWEVVPQGNGQGNGVIDQGNTPLNSASTNLLAQGQSYDLFVRTNCNSGQSTYSGPYTFSTVAPGYTCGFPMVINTFPYTGSSTTCGAGNDYGVQCGGYYGGGEDFVYQLNIPSAGIYYINLSATNGGNYIGWFLKDNANCTTTSPCLANALSGFGTDANGSYTFASAGTYYLIIDTWPSPDCSDFDISISPPTAPNCVPSPTSPVDGGNGCSGASTTLSWPAAPQATGYDVYFGTVVNPPLVSANQPGTTYSAGVLSAGTYYWQVIPKNGIGDASGCSVWSFTVIAAPVGNEFTDPIVISSLPYSGSGDNLASNCWSSNYTGANAASSPDVFYQFTTGPCTDSLLIDVCTASFDTYLHLLDNTGTQIQFNDDSGPVCVGTRSSMKANVDPNTVYYVVVEGYSSNTGTYTLNINEILGLAQDPTSASASVPEVCLGNSVVLSVSGGSLGSGVADWVWYDGGCGNGAPVGTGASVSITPSTPGSHNYYVRAEGPCNMTNCVSVPVLVNNNPPLGSVAIIPGTPNVACVGNTASISAAPVPYATGYSWSGPSGVLFDGQPSPYVSSSNTVTLTFAALPPVGMSGWNICVFATNACGNSVNTKCYFIRARLSTPSTISGSVIGCPGGSGSYSVNPVDGAVSYTWSITGNADINGSGTFTTPTPNATVNFGPSFTTGQLCVYATTACGFNGGSRCMNIGAAPVIPGAISGPSALCPGSSATYSISAVPGAVSYTWSVTGTNISFSGSGLSVSVSTLPGFTSGLVCVTAVSACGAPAGNSAMRCKSIGTAGLGTPGNIGGDPTAGVCGQTYTYSIPSMAGASLGYQWTLPGGVSGSSVTNTITVTYPGAFVSGQICVSGVNACGVGPQRCVNVYGNPGTPVLSGNTTPCIGYDETYTWPTVPGATQYQVIVPFGYTILSGNITNNTYAIINIGPAPGQIGVKAENTCGVSGTGTLMLTPISCRLAGNDNGTSVLLATEVYPNPTTGTLNVQFRSQLDDQHYVIEVLDLAGRVVISEQDKAHSGTNLHVLDMSHLAKGMYMISLQTEIGSQVVRVSVE